MNEISRELLEGQPQEVLNAVNELESRGLVFFVHFGIVNATEKLRQMDRAVAGGFLYEWLMRNCGIATDERV